MELYKGVIMEKLGVLNVWRIGTPTGTGIFVKYNTRRTPDVFW